MISDARLAEIKSALDRFKIVSVLDTEFMFKMLRFYRSRMIARGHDVPGTFADDWDIAGALAQSPKHLKEAVEDISSLREIINILPHEPRCSSNYAQACLERFAGVKRNDCDCVKSRIGQARTRNGHGEFKLTREEIQEEELRRLEEGDDFDVNLEIGGH